MSSPGYNSVPYPAAGPIGVVRPGGMALLAADLTPALFVGLARLEPSLEPGSVGCFEKAHLPTISGVDQNLPGIRTRSEACVAEKCARSRKRINDKCCVAPDLSMATVATGDPVADFSALESFPGAVQMRVVALDRDSRNTDMIGTRIVASQIPRLVCPLLDTAIVPRSFKECQFQP